MQNVLVVDLAVVQHITEVMRSCQRNVVKPDRTPGFVTLELRVACRKWSIQVIPKESMSQLTVVEISQDRGDDDGNALAISSGSSLEIDTEVLICKS